MSVCSSSQKLSDIRAYIRRKQIEEMFRSRRQELLHPSSYDCPDCHMGEEKKGSLTADLCKFDNINSLAFVYNKLREGEYHGTPPSEIESVLNKLLREI